MTSLINLEASRRELGAALRAVRTAAGLTTRQVDGFSTGHVSRVETGQAFPSRAFVARYVAMGGNPGTLYSLFDRARLAAGTVGDDADDGTRSLSDPESDPYVLRLGYLVESISDTYIVGADRGPVRNEHRVLIRPRHPDARYFPFRHAYEEDPRRGVSVVNVGPGLTLPVLEEGPSGTIYAVLGFDPSKTDGTGACKLTWTISMQTKVPVRTHVAGGTRVRIPHAATAVQFTPPALPAQVWWYRDFDSNAGTMLPPNERILTAGADHTYGREFLELDREWWGLAWTWPAA